MRSIRLSLMVYCLALLTVALTAASLLVYRVAEQTLRAKQQAMQRLIEAQYRQRCRDWEDSWNAALLAQAQSLARLVEVQIARDRSDLQPCLRLGILSAALSPNGHVLVPTWLAEGAREPRSDRPASPMYPGAVYRDFRRHLPPNSLGFRQELKFDEMLLPSDTQVGEFFQIDSPPIKPYRSHSLHEQLPLDVLSFEQTEVVRWIYDDTKLTTGTRLRRVVLKASGVPQEFVRPQPRTREPSPNGQRAPRTPTLPPPIRRGPTIYVHCADKLDKRDAAFTEFAQRRDEDMADIAKQTRQSLGDLRARVLGISLIVFAAAAAGTFWLVRFGLSPLRRLCEAVSRVSVKDFRLPLDEQPLPLELRPIAERLAVTLDLLKRAFAREKQAAADISHELRTPLSALLTTIEFALRKPRDAERYRELFGDCRVSAQQMNHIVERMLTLARLDAGVDHLRIQTVDVAALAADCAAVIRPLAEARGLNLTLKCPPPPGDGSACGVRSDPDKLREIVSNLLHNAVQYNRPGGSVFLRMARHNGTVEIEVEDTGIGIAAEARPHLFERFYRGDPSRGGDDLHAGLGLAIVKEYTDLMGGSIGVESREGQGSTFRVVLPAQ